MEKELLCHPLALYPHIEDSVPPDVRVFYILFSPEKYSVFKKENGLICLYYYILLYKFTPNMVCFIRHAVLDIDSMYGLNMHFLNKNFNVNVEL